MRNRIDTCRQWYTRHIIFLLSKSLLRTIAKLCIITTPNVYVYIYYAFCLQCRFACMQKYLNYTWLKVDANLMIVQIFIQLRSQGL